MATQTIHLIGHPQKIKLTKHNSKILCQYFKWRFKKKIFIQFIYFLLSGMNFGLSKLDIGFLLRDSVAFAF
jgi:hypothetical protein